MSNAREDLRATQDSIMADTDRLKDLERQKRRLADDDPAQVELSAEAEQVGEAVRQKTAMQRELIEEVQDS